jgi:hypothetical protein
MGSERLVVRIDDGESLLLFDPLGVPDEIEALAADRETAIVLTAPWHERDTQSLVEQLSVPVEHVLATHGGSTDRAALERPLDRLAALPQRGNPHGVQQ